MNMKYVVRLTDEERQQLQTLVRRGEAHTRKLLYARILLKADANTERWTDEKIAERPLRFPPLRWWRARGNVTARRG